MDWADIVILILPQWLLALMAVATFALSLRVAISCHVAAVPGGYFLTIGAGVLPVAVFYVGAMLGWYDGHVEAGIAMSRITFAILFMSLNAVLMSVCNRD